MWRKKAILSSFFSTDEVTLSWLLSRCQMSYRVNRVRRSSLTTSPGSVGRRCPERFDRARRRMTPGSPAPVGGPGTALRRRPSGFGSGRGRGSARRPPRRPAPPAVRPGPTPSARPGSGPGGPLGQPEVAVRAPRRGPTRLPFTFSARARPCRSRRAAIVVTQGRAGRGAGLAEVAPARRSHPDRRHTRTDATAVPALPP